MLPNDDEHDPQPRWTDQDSGVFSEEHTSDSDDDSDDDEALGDPSEHFREVHERIKVTIAELGGSVAPKLNWSAPKDATWIAATNSMRCRSAGDVYLLLKSSDFVAHDLEMAFDGCEAEGGPDEEGAGLARGPDAVTETETEGIAYDLVLRKWVEMNPSLEFRCFVRGRALIGISQRDLNHFDFLFPMADALRSLIQDFFDRHLQGSFPDADFVFDVYVPPPHGRVWLIDINPWAPRTDPLLFSWLELLRLDNSADAATDKGGSSDGAEEAGEEEVPFVPELRLVRRDDPEAYGFTTPQYSAHKLPKDVVDASVGGPGPMREFADRWKEMLAREE